MNNESSNATASEAASLVEVRRGSITESRHRGHVAVVDGEGQLIARLGSPESVTYLRSAAKPFQALPLITTGAAQRFHFNAKEIAIACGSHNGETIHTETVAGMLRKIGLDMSALKCGAHEPYSPEAARALKERGEEPSVLHNNCSGKHAGMLAVALHLGAHIETYDQPEHPVQVAITRVISEFSGLGIESISTGIDGCGVPVHAMPVEAMAVMYARLVQVPASFDDKMRAAAERITSAMMSHPEMIGGLTESLDTALMCAVPRRLIGKAGAEGLFTAAVLPCREYPRGLGVALKVEDGDKGSRARRPAAIETLRQLGLLSDDALGALASYAKSYLSNHRGDRVGEVIASFELRKADSGFNESAGEEF